MTSPASSRPTFRQAIPALRGRGFALVVTLSLMVLLTIVAVGLLTLSVRTLSTASRGASLAEAKANARLALLLAIGELQKQAGPDTRITARADILDESNPLLTGVWRSWEGDDHESSGRPVSPGDYRSEKEGRFLGWLASGDTETLPDTGNGSGKLTLVGEHSVGDIGDAAQRQIHLAPVRVHSAGDEGAFAWWIGGENQKARLPKPHEPEDDHSSRWAVHCKSHSIADPEVFRMESLLTDPEPADKAISLELADLISETSDPPVSQEFFHDLSPHSVGLLTNVATGGWKKDLSLFTENSSRVGTRRLPLFRVKPGRDILYNLPTVSNPVAPKSMLYPWSAYRGGSIPIYQHGAVTSWENLKDYVLAYREKGISISANGRGVIPTFSAPIDRDNFDFLHRVRVLPVIARIQWVLSHSAGTPTGGSTPAGHLEPRLLLTPVITMWNPYNLEMNFSSVPLEFNIPKPLPVALQYSVNGTWNRNFNSLTGGATNNLPPLSGQSSLRYRIDSPFSLKPGETRVFSPQSRTASSPGTTLVMAPGYRSRGGHYFAIKDNTGKAYVLPPSSRITAKAKFDTEYNDRGLGVGIYLDMIYGGRRHLAYRMIYTPEVARAIYPEITNLADATLSQVRSNPIPFLTTVFGARMASRTHLAAKGFVQSSPLVNYTAMGGKDVAETNIARHYGGTSHPVNSPFDYSFEKVSTHDSLLPNESDTTKRGYIVTGFTKADGLSRCVIAGIPIRPLLSLAELQHWDLRYENPIPPFAFNLIGNSDASPLLPPGAVVNRADARLATNLQHDDSYCANHLLFDDWFFSSIAPDPTTYGSRGRSIRDTYTAFLTGERPLGNRAYRALQQDARIAADSDAEARQLYNEHVDGRDSWQTIASRLEVEGMFNVNSTSEAAWRALLGHARDQQVPYIQESGTSWRVSTSGETDYAFSRFPVAGDVEATESGSSGAFPEAAEFAGYRILDEDILDALAEEIVKQVRRRGPFLSLSEFINRQLSSGDLALSGAVQSALDEIARKSSTNPYAVMESVISRQSVAVPPAAGNAEYQFPQAAVGNSTYGLPGWTRQADVLRPLAPILNARDDTFTIRACGEARDRNGKVTARATCEAVVRRTREYVDSADRAEEDPRQEVNLTFGRRFKLVAFRWLSPDEV